MSVWLVFVPRIYLFYVGLYYIIYYIYGLYYIAVMIVIEFNSVLDVGDWNRNQNTSICYSGNYGNKLSENVPPSSSTTQPTNAVFDGCKYYFLPWSGTKPCVVVDCSFEDVSWRLEAVNVLKKIVNDLVYFVHTLAN